MVSQATGNFEMNQVNTSRARAFVRALRGSVDERGGARHMRRLLKDVGVSIHAPARGATD
jgi:hypothetical protein